MKRPLPYALAIPLAATAAIVMGSIGLLIARYLDVADAYANYLFSAVGSAAMVATIFWCRTDVSGRVRIWPN